MLSPVLTDRRVPRISATIPLTLKLASDSKANFEGYTVDVSQKGLRLRTMFVLYAGDRLGVACDAETDRSIPSRVVWVQRTALGGSLAGIEFLED